jgi:glycine oxidase
VEKDEFDQRPTRMGYDRLISIGQRLWPAMQDVSPVAHWAGIRPGSEQRLPWLGEVPGHQGVFLACGHYRNGLVSAPGSACLLARLISGDAADVDPEPFAIPASAAVG